MKEDKTHPGRQLHKYEGILELYYETGMEGCHAVIFHDDRGNHEGPHWDTKNKPNEKFMYRSLAWSIWFGQRLCLYNIRIFNKRNKVVYEGPLTKDKRAIAKFKYRLSFIPKEISLKRWLTILKKEYRAELYTNDIPSAIKEDYKLTFDIGEMVYDDLTGKDAVVMNITLGKDPKTKTVGYWVNGDYLQGGRHPWEISKIDWMARFKKEQEEEKAKNGNQDG